jgi:hypothetical protein
VKSNLNRIARRIAPAIVLALAPMAAFAQNTAERAGAEAWFRSYIEPNMRHHWDDMSIENPPVLYDPNEAPHIPGRGAMDRTVYRHQAEFGSYRGVVVAGDLPATRSERVDVRDWNDIADRSNPSRAEMFRFYLEPVEPTPPLCRAIIP